MKISYFLSKSLKDFLETIKVHCSFGHIFTSYDYSWQIDHHEVIHQKPKNIESKWWQFWWEEEKSHLKYEIKEAYFMNGPS